MKLNITKLFTTFEAEIARNNYATTYGVEFHEDYEILFSTSLPMALIKPALLNGGKDLDIANRKTIYSLADKDDNIICTSKDEVVILKKTTDYVVLKNTRNKKVFKLAIKEFLVAKK